MKKAIRLLALVLVLTLGLSGIACAAQEEEITPYSNAYISSMIGALSKNGDTLYISFTVCATGTMTSIGASCIKLYTSDGDLVKTYWPSSYSTMLGSNRGMYSATLSYDGTDGTTYYAVITGYAKNSSGSGILTYTTATLTL